MSRPSTAHIVADYADNVSKRRRLRKSQASLKIVPSYLQKETWDRQYLTLKSFNNTLASQNEKLKAQNRHLQYQLQKIQKNITNPKQQIQSEKEWASLKGMMGFMRKQLEQLRCQNKKMKRSVRYTTISQMELQNQQILLESQRMRQLLTQQIRINAQLKYQQSKYHQQNKKLRHFNTKLNHQNNKLKQVKLQIPQKGRNQIPNTKRVSDKPQQEKSKVIQKQIKKQQANKLSSQRSGKQENKTGNVQCLSCRELNHQNEYLQKQINTVKVCNQQMRTQIQKLKAEIQKLQTQIYYFQSIKSNKLIQNTIKIVTNEQINNLRQFLINRYQQLQITQQQLVSAFDKLLNKDGCQHILISDLLEIIIDYPFSLVFDRHIQIMICSLCHSAITIVGSQILIQESQRISKKLVRSNFIILIGEYSVTKQDLFIDQQIVQHSLIKGGKSKEIDMPRTNGSFKSKIIKPQQTNNQFEQQIQDIEFDLLGLYHSKHPNKHNNFIE